jgi:alpha-1,3-rhamnosyltransferase
VEAVGHSSGSEGTVYNRPLVSIIISAFNSSGFIEETLHSIRNQTWAELELIVSDDCSQDNTVEICRNWIRNYKSRFVRAELITNEYNKGVAGNANRGIGAAKGVWIKFLGADDTLKPTCIEDNMSWIASHPETAVLFSKIEVYKEKFSQESLISVIPGDPITKSGIMAPERDAYSQYRMLLVSDRIHFSPSVFIKREVLLSVGAFEEEYKTFEDYPVWLKLTKAGIRLDFMDRITVNYRMHSMAINNKDKNILIKPNYFLSEDFRRRFTYPNLPFLVRNDQKFKWLVCQIFRSGVLNRDRIINVWVKDLLTVYMNPFRWLLWIRMHLPVQLQHEEFYS